MTACTSITATLVAYPSGQAVRLSLPDLAELIHGPHEWADPPALEQRVARFLELERQRQAPR